MQWSLTGILSSIFDCLILLKGMVFAYSFIVLPQFCYYIILHMFRRRSRISRHITQIKIIFLELHLLFSSDLRIIFHIDLSIAI